jgi:subtilisin family serine protease
LFPGATKDGTIAIPGNSAAVVTVGAAVNRIDWTDRQGDSIGVARLGSILEPSDETIAYFSGAGPTSDGRLKPDLVATGAFVAGAMSADADPRVQAASIFASSSFCTPHDECAVVDDQHAVTIGTSMAAPLVTGAAALLLQADPSLTSNRVLARLQAGAHHPLGTVPLASQIGAGALDLLGSLDVERLEAQPAVRDPSSATSWLTIGAETARPDPSSPVPAVLKLRDATGLVSGVGPEELLIDVERGRVTQGPDSPAPGLVTFAVAANADTGGDDLRIEVRRGGTVLASRSVPIAVDVNVARRGFFAKGGCALGRRDADGDATGAPLLGLTLLAASRRRSAARRVRSRGRTDEKDRARRGSFRR